MSVSHRSNQKKRNTVHAGSLHAGLVSPPDELPPPFYEPPPPESLDLQPFGTLYSGDLSSDTGEPTFTASFSGHGPIRSTAPFFNYTPNSYPYPNTPTHTLLPPLPFQTDYCKLICPHYLCRIAHDRGQTPIQPSHCSRLSSRCLSNVRFPTRALTSSRNSIVRSLRCSFAP
jgi:hypothetical protein